MISQIGQIYLPSPDEVGILNKFQKHLSFKLITRRQILDSSKLKGFADDNFKFDENNRKLFKPVENTVGKGEIARYEQFLLFPQCFQKAYFSGASKGVIVWQWVKVIIPHFAHKMAAIPTLLCYDVVCHPCLSRFRTETGSNTN